MNTLDIIEKKRFRVSNFMGMTIVAFLNLMIRQETIKSILAPLNTREDAINGSRVHSYKRLTRFTMSY